MLLFLDTANLDDIKTYASCGVVDGITTNPTLIAREGANLKTRIREITKLVDGPISVEVVSTSARGMLKEAREYASWHENIHVKIPMGCKGLGVVRQLTSEGIRTNVTLIFSPAQAMMAAKAGATFVSPFIGRLDDLAEDGLVVIEEIMEMFYNYDFDTKVLVASVHNPRHVIESAKMGADIATLPPKIFGQMMEHPMTDLGLKKFLADWRATRKPGKSKKSRKKAKK